MAGADNDGRPGQATAPGGSQPAGLEAPPPPSADPTRKTDHTSDPQADDPGNGAD
jgi:hypothetical protein